MAKKIQGATITFKVTDDGTLQMLGNQATAAGKGLDGVGKSAGDTRRNLQAMSGRVESGTKGFARMQQGTGGLVQAYAILASTIFAVTAAFRALENAQNIQNQIRGFKELTAITGTSMLTITNNVRAATGGLLDFQTAAQQTAIATAAGFSSNQITQLAEGAKNASVALGRDLTDSFNRLIRGVTKAEPELLDELGVILRLDIATRKFAAANGLSAEKLSIAQRRMAVFNEVAEQLNNNFGDISTKANELLNPFTKFSTMIQDIGIEVGGFFVKVLSPLIGFLERNSSVLGFMLAVIAKNLIGQMIPSLTNVSAAMTQFAENGKNKLKDLGNAQAANQKRKDKIDAKFKVGEIRKNKFFSDGLKKRGIKEKAFTQLSGKQQLKTTLSLIKEEKKRLAVTGKTSSARLKAYIAVETRIRKEISKTSVTMMTKMTGAALSVESAVVRMGIVGRTAIAGIGTAAATAAPVFAALGALINVAFGVFMAMTTITFIADMIPSVRAAKEAMKGLTEEAERQDEAFVLAGIAFDSFGNTHLPKVVEELEKTELAGNAAAKAIDFLANAMANVGDIETGVATIESRMNQAAGVDSKKNLGGVGSFQSRQAESAGAIFMSTFMTEAIAAAQTDKTKVQEVLTDIFTPALKPTPQSGVDLINSAGYMNDEQKSNIISGFQLDYDQSTGLRKGSDTATGEARAKEILGLLGDFSKSDSIEQRELKMNAITAAIERYNIDMRRFIVLTEAGEGTLFGLSDAAENAFGTLAGANKETKDQIEGVKNVDIALKDLTDTLDLMASKPTKLGRLASGLGQVFNELEGVDRNTIVALENIDDEMAKVIGKKKTEINLYDVAIYKLQTQLAITREQAQALIDNNETLIDQIKLTDKLNRMAKSMDVLDKTRLALMGQLKDRHTKQQIIVQKINDLERKRFLHNSNLLATSTMIREENETTTELTQDDVNLLAAKSVEMEGQLEILRNQLDYFFQIKKTVLETFDAAGATALTDIMIGGDEKEAFKKMAENLQKEAAKSLSGQIMQPITGGLKRFLGLGKDDLGVKMTPEAEAIKLAHDHHVTKLQEVLQNHAKAFDNEMGTVKNIGEVTHMAKGEDAEGNVIYQKVIDKVGEEMKAITGPIEESLKGSFSELFGGLKDGIGSMFSGLFGGGKDGGGFFKTLLSGIGSFFGFGGAAPLAKGGIMGYANGGIARQPTYLVGEGKQHEAVVPLPDNRSIPVDLGKSGGGDNNVSINVNMAEGKTDTKADAEQGKQLGQAINNAILAELEKQQRPGGILARG